MSTASVQERRGAMKYWLVVAAIATGVLLHPFVGAVVAGVSAWRVRDRRFQIVLAVIAVAWLIFASFVGAFGVHGGGSSVGIRG